MTATLEREIKLRFDSAETARQAILDAGGTPTRGRRLQEDYLVDSDDRKLARLQSILRVRMEPGRSLLTFKGPVQPSPMKLREERETVAGDGEVLLFVLEQLGFRVWFRYQKYREEFGCRDAAIALDETPIGTFVEIEGSELAINEMTEALGRSARDFISDSYRGLYVKECADKGIPSTHMVFEED